MKPLFLISILLSAPSFAFDLGKLLTKENLDAIAPLMAHIAQAPTDRSCEALLNPEKRLQLWQFDQKRLLLMQNLNTTALGDADAQKINPANIYSLIKISPAKIHSLISQATSFQLLLNESQQCLIKPLDWENICSNNQPTLAEQCNEKIDLKYWVNQDWQCADHNEQCTQKLPQLQTTQQASRQLAEWALDNASTIYPAMERSTLKLFLGLNPQ